MLAAATMVAHGAPGNPPVASPAHALTGRALSSMLDEVMAVYNKSGSLLKLDPGRQWILQNIWCVLGGGAGH